MVVLSEGSVEPSAHGPGSWPRPPCRWARRLEADDPDPLVDTPWFVSGLTFGGCVAGPRGRSTRHSNASGPGICPRKRGSMELIHRQWGSASDRNRVLTIPSAFAMIVFSVS